MRKEETAIDTLPHTRTRAYPPCPLFVDFEGVDVLVVGAGSVALRKVQTMLAYGARVTVVSPHAVEDIRRLAREQRIAFVERGFQPGDTAGARYVICATDNPDVNELVSAEAREAGLLVNVVDEPSLCNTIVPAVVRRGKLQIAVSTSGAAPSAARNIRADLEERYPDYWEPFLDTVAEVRALVKQRVGGPAACRTGLYERLTDGSLLQEFAQGARPGAEDVYERYVAALVERRAL